MFYYCEMSLTEGENILFMFISDFITLFYTHNMAGAVVAGMVW